MNAEHNIRLTSTEMATLWTAYINDTMTKCVLDYFLNKVEDNEIKPVIEFALNISERQIAELTLLFQTENFPIPKGFTNGDVNENAKLLFSNSFFLYYVKNMTKVGLATYSAAYTMASRKDIRAFFLDNLNRTEKLDQKVTDILQSKGLYIRPPYISVPDDVEFVNSNRFLSGGFFGFVEKRPLLSIEIAHLFANVQTNNLGKGLLLGFSQVAQSQELRQYFARGVEISQKHMTIFGNTLMEDKLPVPMSFDSEVTDSKVAPFSDKLMLFHVSVLVAAGFGNYGIAAAASPRKDIATTYIRLAAEIAQYTEGGAKLMISQRWMEEPPSAPNRKQLQNV